MTIYGIMYGLFVFGVWAIFFLVWTLLITLAYMSKYDNTSFDIEIVRNKIKFVLNASPMGKILIIISGISTVVFLHMFNITI